MVPLKKKFSGLTGSHGKMKIITVFSDIRFCSLLVELQTFRMKYILLAFSYSLISLYLCFGGTTVKKCKSKLLRKEDSIYISGCDELPCILKKGTNIIVKYDVTPTTEIADVSNRVYATVLGIPLKFIGVDGGSACGKFTDKKTGEKVPCPLKPGGTYVYQDQFKIFNFYPAVRLDVHWALKSQGMDILCFEVPARIV